MRKFQIVVYAVPNFLAIKGAKIDITGCSGIIDADDISVLRQGIRDFLGQLVRSPNVHLLADGMEGYVEDFEHHITQFAEFETMWEQSQLAIGGPQSPFSIQLTEVPPPGMVAGQ
jgi:hypothetical protein